MVLALSASGAALAWNNVIVPRTDWSWTGRTVAHAAVGMTAVAIAHGAGSGTGWKALGLHPGHARAGLAAGARVALMPSLACAAAAGALAARRRMAGRPAPPMGPLAAWTLFHIPIGTVLAEELLFRSALDALWRDALPLARHGRWPARLASAATFGAWHIAPARSAGHSVGSTVLVTMLGGVVFTSLTSATSSVAAPAVVHYAVNAGGALVSHMVDAKQDAIPRGRNMARGRSTPARPEDVRAAVLAVADWLRDPDHTEAPPKPLVAAAARACAHALEQSAPGHSVEVRVPPHVAIQCIEGPRHTRGTPPNVVELTPRSWLLLATGLASLEQLCAAGQGDASGSRATEITRWMPIVPL